MVLGQLTSLATMTGSLPAGEGSLPAGASNAPLLVPTLLVPHRTLQLLVQNATGSTNHVFVPTRIRCLPSNHRKRSISEVDDPAVQPSTAAMFFRNDKPMKPTATTPMKIVPMSPTCSAGAAHHGNQGNESLCEDRQQPTPKSREYINDEVAWLLNFDHLEKEDRELREMLFALASRRENALRRG
jgi:hypothetical protein